MEKTIFQKIIDREIPATIVYEDADSMAFLDITPIRKGHLLLISKEPYQWLTDVPDELLGKMFIKAKELAIKMKEGIPCDYVQLGVLGTDVPHFHVHLIPRIFTDKNGLPRPEEKYDDNEMQLYADKIKARL